MSKHKKLAAFDQVPKVSDGEVDGQQFMIKGTVPRLCWAELLGEVSNGAQSTIDVLLQYCSNSTVRSVSHNAGVSIGFGMYQESCVSESLLDCIEGSGGLFVQSQMVGNLLWRPEELVEGLQDLGTVGDKAMVKVLRDQETHATCGEMWVEENPELR